MEALQNPPSKDAAPLMSNPVPTASGAEWVADVSSIVVVETSPNTLHGDVALLMMSLP